MHVPAAAPPMAVEKPPAAHAAHPAAEPIPVAVEKRPALQPVHALAPALDAKVPAPHALHTSLSVAPMTAEKLPAEHPTQLLAPAPVWNVPAPHDVQAVALGEDAYVPEGQTAHPVAPWLGMYVPGEHGAQGEGQIPSPPSHRSRGSDWFITHAV